MENKKFFVMVLIVSTFLGAVGQLLFKLSLSSGVLSLLGVLLFFGLVAYGISTLLYFYILSRVHLGWAYGFQGLSYIFATILAVFVIGEQVSVLRWVGIALIAIGVALVGLS